MSDGYDPDMNTIIQARISELEAEREQVRAELQADYDRQVKALADQMNLQLAQYSAAINELKKIAEAVDAAEMASDE